MPGTEGSKMGIFKIGRNDPCWCGSGRKYKQCHEAFDERLKELKAQGKRVPTRKMIKTPAQIEGIRKAGIMNTKVLDHVEPFVKEGVSTEELNKIVHEYTLSLGCTPAPLNYEGYPKSVCISINDVVCHGIPSPDRILRSGDIVNVDCTTICEGYYGDASRMYCIGDVDPAWKKLVDDTKVALDLGLKAAKPWGHLGDVGYAINTFAEAQGYTVVREIGGHGVGVEFHEDPWVPHIGEPGTDIVLAPGMTFTIEPMINLGVPDVYQDEDDGWTIYTDDGQPSAQWEYTIVMNEDGPEILSY